MCYVGALLELFEQRGAMRLMVESIALFAGVVPLAN
jgi:hypothetical protein